LLPAPSPQSAPASKMPKIVRAVAHFRLDDRFTALPSGITQLLQTLSPLPATLIRHRGN
jgi:hypothetical protein